MKTIRIYQRTISGVHGGFDGSGGATGLCERLLLCDFEPDALRRLVRLACDPCDLADRNEAESSVSAAAAECMAWYALYLQDDCQLSPGSHVAAWVSARRSGGVGLTSNHSQNESGATPSSAQEQKQL
eukprot:218522-Chlamydomonas_euryale.AAC.5